MPDNPSDFVPADAAVHVWSTDGECTFVPVNMFPTDHDKRGITAAKLVCAACPVRPECLAEAMARGEQWGVWGGLTAEERVSLRRRVARQNMRVRTNGEGEPLDLDEVIEDVALADVTFHQIEDETDELAADATELDHLDGAA